MNGEKPYRTWEEILADPTVSEGVRRYARDQLAGMRRVAMRKANTRAKVPVPPRSPSGGQKDSEG